MTTDYGTTDYRAIIRQIRSA